LILVKDTDIDQPEDLFTDHCRADDTSDKSNKQGSCLHSPGGFKGTGTVADPFVPVGPNVYAATTMAQATWNFDGRGTATFQGENYATIFPGGVGSGALERENAIATPAGGPLHFDYSVDAHGWISGTVREIGINLEGRISTDHKIITLNNGGQLQSGGTAICNYGRLLFRVKN
jgi:hypothetical protein